MATTKKTPAKKTPAAKKPKAAATNASVGPVAGTLTAEPDAVKETVKPTAKAKAAVKKEEVTATLNGQFDAIEQTLQNFKDGPKPPRQLRWALKSLEAARDQAIRFVDTNL